MAKKTKKKQRSKREMRNLRMQQIVFVAIGVILILSMVLSMTVNF